MCSGIRVPLREIGLLPGGYGITSPCLKILWNEEDIVWFPAQKMMPHFLIMQLAILSSVISNHRMWLQYSCSQPVVIFASRETFGDVWRCFWLSHRGWHLAGGGYGFC